MEVIFWIAMFILISPFVVLGTIFPTGKQFPVIPARQGMLKSRKGTHDECLYFCSFCSLSIVCRCCLWNPYQ